MSRLGAVASPALAAHVRRLIEREGLEQASKTLGLGREALARIVAGIGVREGTLQVVRNAMNVERVR